MPLKLLLLIFLPYLLFASDFHSDKTIKTNSASVIKIFAHTVSPNYYVPWSMNRQSASTGSGVIIKDNYILTAAHVISDASYLEVQKSLDPKKYFATVKWVAHDADLALLEISDKSFFQGTKPLSIGKMPKRQDGVAVYGYPAGGTQISITQGIISRIEQTVYVHSKIDLLSIQIDAAINPGNSGGPAFNKKGEIVGIAMQGMLASNSIGYIIPTPIIKHFLDDIKDGHYDGFPDDGIYVQLMENETLKAHYKMKKRTGVLITTVLKNSSSDGYLKVGDVILSVDGYTLSDDNSVKTETLERVASNYLIRRHFIGDKARMTILRQGKKIDLEVPMKKFISKIPFEHEVQPQYYIYGGLVFMPLTRNYLYAWGSGWAQKAPLEFLHALQYADLEETTPKEIVFLQGALQDRVNAGYTPRNEIITKVNEHNISSLVELSNLIEAEKGDVVITTQRGNTYVINKKSAQETQERILQRYGVRAKSYMRE